MLPFAADLFQGTFSLGTAVIAVMMLGFAGWYATKNKALESSQSQSDHWRDDYLAEREARKDAEERFVALLAESEERYARQRELKHQALNEVSALKMATDLTQVMRLITDMNERLQTTEARLLARFEAFAKVQEAQTHALEAIAARLNNPQGGMA